MLFSNPRNISEAAAAEPSTELLDPEKTPEVKDMVKELEDDLADIELEVSDKDKKTDGDVLVTAESVALMESATTYGGAKYLIRFEDLRSVMESEAEMAAEAEAEPGEAPTPEQVEEHMPEPQNVIDDIAEKNGVEPEQVAVVITAESMRMIARGALLEAKCGQDAECTRKLKQTKKIVHAMKEAGCKMVGSDKKCKKDDCDGEECKKED